MAESWTVRPLTAWPGSLTPERRVSPFYAYWDGTTKLLGRELDALEARNVVLQMAITESDIRQDGKLRQQARPAHPGIIVAFESRHGPMQYACDSFLHWKDNVRAVALSLEALRKMERYGVVRRGEQYTGWLALPETTMTRDEAEAFIRSYGGATEAMRRTHPDHGGSREEFDRVLAARKLLAESGTDGGR